MLGAVKVRMSSTAIGSKVETVVEQVAAVLPNHSKYVLYCTSNKTHHNTPHCTTHTIHHNIACHTAAKHTTAYHSSSNAILAAIMTE